MNKVISVDKALEHIKDGMTVMVGGFMACGSPNKLLDHVVKSGVKDLTIICNDAGLVDDGVGKLISNNQVKKLIASHIGLNPEAGRRMNEGIMDIDLVPQGTLAERVRCGGNGLGGVLTPTGFGTIIEEGKQIIESNGKKYLLELPIRADIALLVGYKVDKSGNIYYRGSTRNFNPLMAMAADFVIVEADNIVEVGEIKQEVVHTPGLCVNAIVDGGTL